LDRHSKIAEPRFKNIQQRDFTLLPDSPAFALGFCPIDITPTGLYGDRAWRNLPSRFPHRAFERAEPPPQRNTLAYSFEEETPGDLPDEGYIQEGEGSASIRVASGGIKGGQCLRIQDSPNLKYSYDPHFYYRPEFTNGIVTETFWLKHEPGAIILHEWRDWPANKNLITGPQVHINGQGELAVSGKKLLTLSSNQWHRLVITCGLGTHATGTWKLSVERPNEAAQQFPALTCSPAFKRLDWLGFTSLETKTTVFCIDDLTLEKREP
jgi:hypothetical protein